VAETRPRNVEVYGAPDGSFPFDDYLDSLRDLKAKLLIDKRIAKIRTGLIGTFDTVGDGIIELKVDHGPGYRIYCTDDGKEVLLLLAGSKATQQADINTAKQYWSEHKS
jgi:putative addiction module killer protein